MIWCDMLTEGIYQGLDPAAEEPPLVKAGPQGRTEIVTKLTRHHTKGMVITGARFGGAGDSAGMSA